MLEFSFRPLSSWPGERTPRAARKKAPFSAGYGRTLDDLERELKHLGGRDIIIEAETTFEHIRNDGRLRSSAVLAGPGIVLSFDSRFGPLRYACDTFADWRDNLRAIALTLERQRAIDRYGATRRGEQYVGWSALPPGGSSMRPAMTVEEAARFIDPLAFAGIVRDPEQYRAAYRSCAKRMHPDAGGSAEEFTRLQEAKRVLDKHHEGGL